MPSVYRLKVSLRILSCPKCLSFWTALVWMLWDNAGLVRSVAVSFFCAYAATWAALMLDGLSVLYNWIYEQITETTDASEDAEAGPDGPASGDDEVS